VLSWGKDLRGCIDRSSPRWRLLQMIMDVQVREDKDYVIYTCVHIA
jgi:hypothetical protein